ncbi:RAVE complex subunit Rav2 [Schizosaccharomyces pombe]|uniref:Regulator of V-ATPase in vacuolar membrane protein 2 n=1 Tax=Schizosaccharomyces pombe (strain 972 / ATCC 24843) TaxID=284812 RepID=RAV2_SCHPO|nr:RAVE complex subunit Rav2 [Schizosaccharomyces pombe]O74387.1 RecName: Full=Regulator of V-ATPase in vacuolar membrane protein 2; AltName: Full=RAVE complex subunit rav2 [Schizosaccharomyces pombe 972h-]CAA20308.1 RAVE complex subunit Rav2 [Schizosaccharomyces pombe]|eukprot:NP_595763.1 RAVE complex subunit Rav2 [Schizosaccharomyces pombe]
MQTEIDASVIVKEKEWLETNVLPEFWESMSEGLKEALNLISSDDPTVLVFTSPKTDAVKGIVSRSSSNVVRVNVTAKVGRTTHVLKLKDSAIIHLDQILNLSNYMHYALYCLPRLRHNTERAIKELQEILHAIVCLLHSIMQEESEKEEIPSNASSISLKSQNSIVSRTSNPFSCLNHSPRQIHKTVRNHLFSPPLPSNLALSFSISNASVCLHLFRLSGPNEVLESFAKNSVDIEMLKPFVSQRIDAFSQDPILLAVTAKLSALQKKVNDVSYRFKTISSSLYGAK